MILTMSIVVIKIIIFILVDNLRVIDDITDDITCLIIIMMYVLVDNCMVQVDNPWVVVKIIDDITCFIVIMMDILVDNSIILVQVDNPRVVDDIIQIDH